ncbi:MAG TPA: molybdopterin-binding/glycosyltransferase family 2 protein, partial [Rhizomicrobium sp.]|nr:molybdopterin-binding/glycosyltransferase family 2 protein [Rhizomicrobium sp.]
MQFGAVSIALAEGALLAHARRVDGRLLRKGRVLSAEDIRALTRAGVAELVVARLEDSDVEENEAARRIAARCAGAGLVANAPFTGRVNLYAACAGVVEVDAAAIDALNGLDEAITIATLAPFARVDARAMVATIKIIPFAAPAAAVEAAERLLAAAPLRVAGFRPRRAALISTTLPDLKPSLLDKNRSALEARMAALGGEIVFERRVAHEAGALAEALRAAEGCDPILVFGASAITDRRDVIPAAVEMAGGVVRHFGMPVDPGNLLLLGEMGGADVIGLPGCARSPKRNSIDFVLERLAAGLTVTGRDIAATGVGGLLTEIGSRPQPRDEVPVEALRAPVIAAVVLAAGMSSRMGQNKLLLEVGGQALIRRTVETVLKSAAAEVIVVVGRDADRVTAALAGLPVTIVINDVFTNGLSTSLKAGLNCVSGQSDGAMIVLGDMPGITPQMLDTLMAAFRPAEGRAICVASHGGKR